MLKVLGSLHHANALKGHLAARHDPVHHTTDEQACKRVDAEPGEQDDRGSERRKEEDIVSSDAVRKSWSGTARSQRYGKSFQAARNLLPAPIRPIALAALQAINTYGPSLIQPFWIANVPQK